MTRAERENFMLLISVQISLGSIDPLPLAENFNPLWTSLSSWLIYINIFDFRPLNRIMDYGSMTWAEWENFALLVSNPHHSCLRSASLRSGTRGVGLETRSAKFSHSALVMEP